MLLFHIKGLSCKQMTSDKVTAQGVWIVIVRIKSLIIPLYSCYFIQNQPEQIFSVTNVKD